jgi:hypothetical protein
MDRCEDISVLDGNLVYLHFHDIPVYQDERHGLCLCSIEFSETYMKTAMQDIRESLALE